MLKFNSPAKINIFLKIIGKKDNYHLINSRFIRYEALFDEVRFIKKDKDTSDFKIVGSFNCKKEDNTIYRAYKLLKEFSKNRAIDTFLNSHFIEVKKNIPTGAGLGGGSSNAATFILAMNEIVKLGLQKKELFAIGERVGADVNFFLSDYKSANVSGIGEVVEEFEDNIPEIDLKFINIHSNTAKVYKAFTEHYFDIIDENLAKKMLVLSSKELLKTYSADRLNDLLKPLLLSHPSIKDFIDDNQFLSGSGSTFFKVKNNG